ncbi:DAPG hydrolase family protein [Luteipulveratus halotolerans]|uniref:DAPG hydrolase family protein n=1 Tax=Luteipulveratus halotolerans TaxID=1631356 RepID=UPI0006811DFC|nr:hypothetical protein [Luteipulveratus halotolerans]
MARTSYALTAADRRPLPPAYRTEPRHLGYRGTELDRPFAGYMATATSPVQPHVPDVLAAGPSPARLAYDVDEASARLSRPGYDPLETGWAELPGGVLFVSTLTDMPGVTASMWDWWFGWHSTDTARYKLWHPDAHQFTTIGEDRSGDRTLTDRQRYIGNVSYVDEYIGADLHRLAIRFVDPSSLGLADRVGTTHICARVTLSDLPVAIGWLVHQVRPTDSGSEMRSRFFLRHFELMALSARSLAPGVRGRALSALPGPVRAGVNRVLPVVGSRLTPSTLCHDMVEHCAAEMNHLASFLPSLHAEFGDVP